jgi:hypothetical protein
VVNGRNGAFAVDEHTDQDSGARSMIAGQTRKDAEWIRSILADAYRRGREDQAADVSRETEPPYIGTYIDYP